MDNKNNQYARKWFYHPESDCVFIDTWMGLEGSPSSIEVDELRDVKEGETQKDADKVGKEFKLPGF